MYVQSNVINTCWLKMKFSALTETDLGMQFAAEDVASVWWSLSHKAQTVAAALRSRSHLLNFILVWFSSSFVMRRDNVTQQAEGILRVDCRHDCSKERAAAIFALTYSSCARSTWNSAHLHKLSKTYQRPCPLWFVALMRWCHQRLQEIDVTVTCPNSRPRAVRWSSGQVSSKSLSSLHLTSAN